MSKTLHILNGDATLHVFKATGLKGEVLVWREVLSEGPVSASNLWQTREKWISETYGETPSGYHEKVISELEKLQNVEQYDSIVLWFEFDLLCQINLLCVLNLLEQAETALPPIYLICPDRFDGIPHFKGLGMLSAAQLTSLWPTKIQLTADDLKLGAEAWQLYVENDPAQLAEFLNRDFGKLHLLKPALQAHLRRCPKGPKQLNHIEESLIQIVNSGVRAKPEIHKAFWEKESIYGLGDSQIDAILKQLEAKGEIKTTLF